MKSKFRLVESILCVLFLVVLEGCGGTKDKLVDSTYKGQELSLYIWPEYIPDDVISDFENSYGVTVNVTTFDSNEEMLAKVQSSSEGTYDIVCPSDYMVKYMSDNGMLAEIDKDKITNYKNLDDEFLGQYFDEENKYSIPLASGEIIPCYDSSVLGDNAITSLDDLFDKKYKDGLVVLDGMREIIGMTSKSLGYSLNESDDAKLEKVNEKLQSLKDNIYTMTFAAAHERILSGEVATGYMFNGNVAQAQLENKDIVAVWPKEGSYIWLDNMCILNTSKKQDLASVFINYILDAKVDAKIREEIPSTDPNKAGWELVSDEIKSCDALVIPEDQMEKSEYAMDLDDDTLSKYTEMWTEFTK